MACWPLAGRVYSRFYHAGGNFLFGSFGANGKVRFEETGDPSFDTRISLVNVGRMDANGKLKQLQCPCSIRRCGYIHAVFLTALIVATPVPIRRKLWALLWGLILIHCFIAAVLGIWIAFNFCGEPLYLFAMSPFWKGKLNVPFELFILNGTSGFVAAVIIWVLVTFRREDWSRITLAGTRLGKGAAAVTESTETPSRSRTARSTPLCGGVKPALRLHKNVNHPGCSARPGKRSCF
jgi:hypothetical protein